MVVAELFAKLGFQVDKSSHGQAQHAVEELEHGLEVLKEKLELLGISLAIGELVKGLKELVQETAASATGTAKTAQKVGIARVAYEELAHAAHETGTPIESLESGLRLLSRSLYETTLGNHQLSYAFGQLGVRTRDSAGKLRGADAVLIEISERFERMPDGPKKTALAMHLFGRAGADLIPMLNKGREGLEEFRREAHELGLVFSDEDVAAAKEFKKASGELDATMEGLKRRIGVALLPQMAKMKKEFAEWIKANRELIRQRIVALAESLAKAFKLGAQLLEPLVDLIALLASDARLALTAVVALGLALNAAFLLPAAAILFVLMCIEELWGWITGKRKTLLEDWLGPWSEFKKTLDNLLFVTNPEDSGIVKVIKAINRGIRDAVENLGKLREALGLTPIDLHPVKYDPQGNATWGGKTHSREEVVADSVEAMRRRAMSKALEKVRDRPFPWVEPGEWGSWWDREKNYQSTTELLSEGWPRPSDVNYNVELHVTPPANENPAEWGKVIGEAVKREFEKLYDAEAAKAHADVTR